MVLGPTLEDGRFADDAVMKITLLHDCQIALISQYSIQDCPVIVSIMSKHEKVEKCCCCWGETCQEI